MFVAVGGKMVETVDAEAKVGCWIRSGNGTKVLGFCGSKFCIEDVEGDITSVLKAGSEWRPGDSF